MNDSTHSATSPAPLKAWLADVVDSLDIHHRSRWGLVLGVSEQAVGHWANGQSLPKAEHLRAIVVLLRERYPAKAAEALARWDAMLDLPLRDAWGERVRTELETLGRYIMLPLWERLQSSVDILSYPQQEKVLGDALQAANLRRLGVADRAESVRVPDPATPAERSAGPSHAVANAIRLRKSVNVWEDKDAA